MSPEIMSIIIIISFFVVAMLGVPIVFCLAGLSIIFIIVFIGPHALFASYSNVFRMFMTDIFVAIPLFIIMATILEFSGIAEMLYNTMYKWFAGIRGGLAVGTIAVCTIIAAMSGLSATGIVTMGLLALPEMHNRGYSKIISLGCIPAGGALGPIIPPSITMILVASFGSVSVGKMFMGGLLPGLVMSFLFMLYIIVRCYLQKDIAPALPPEERATWKAKFISLLGLLPALLLVFLVLGTIYTGACTPTEAGGIGAFGSLICAIINKRLGWGVLKNASSAALKVSAMCMWILGSAAMFSSLLSMTKVTGALSDFINNIAIAPILIVILMLIIVFIMGMFMDGTAIIMITLPIFMPIIGRLGFDPLWFCLLFSVDITIGGISPPYGIGLFFLKGVASRDVTVSDIYTSVWPYVWIMITVILLGIIYPPLYTWLPNMLIK